MPQKNRHGRFSQSNGVRSFSMRLRRPSLAIACQNIVCRGHPGSDGRVRHAQRPRYPSRHKEILGQRTAHRPPARLLDLLAEWPGVVRARLARRAAATAARMVAGPDARGIGVTATDCAGASVLAGEGAAWGLLRSGLISRRKSARRSSGWQRWSRPGGQRGPLRS